MRQRSVTALVAVTLIVLLFNTYKTSLVAEKIMEAPAENRTYQTFESHGLTTERNPGEEMGHFIGRHKSAVLAALEGMKDVPSDS